VALFVIVGGQLGINFTLPFSCSCSSWPSRGLQHPAHDRIARRRHPPLRQAWSPPSGRRDHDHLGRTGAGGTFGILAIATSGQVRQIALGSSLGILLDTFVVRTLLVPSRVLLGRWNCGRPLFTVGLGATAGGWSAPGAGRPAGPGP